MDLYTENVLKPLVLEVSKSVKDEDGQINYFSAQANKNAVLGNIAKHREVRNHYQDIGAQANQRSSLNNTYNKNIFEADKKNVQNQVSNSMSYEMAIKLDKSKKQKDYKDMLNYQCSLNKKLRLQGGMSKQEKKMNKRELNAFKNFKNAQFTMLPGLNDTSKFASQKNLSLMMNPVYSNPDLNRSQREIVYDRSEISRNSIEGNISRNNSQEKSYNLIGSNEYQDVISKNRPALTRESFKQKLASRNNRQGDVLQTSASQILRDHKNMTPMGSQSLKVL